MRTEYVKAGAEILETNTFGVNRNKLRPARVGRTRARDRRGGRKDHTRSPLGRSLRRDSVESADIRIEP